MADTEKLLDHAIAQQVDQLLYGHMYSGTIKGGSGDRYTIEPDIQHIPVIDDVPLYHQDTIRDIKPGAKCIFTFIQGHLSMPIIISIDADSGSSSTLVQGDQIYIGSSKGAAIHPVAYGDIIMNRVNAVIQQLMTQFAAHTHLIIKPVPSEPTTPPVTPLALTPLDPTIYSTKVKTE